MAEQVVWATKRVTLAVPVPSVAALRTRVWLVGPPLLLALLGAVLAIQAPKQTFRSQSEVIFRSGPSVRLEQDVSPAAVRVARGKPTEVVAHSPALAERVIRAAGVPGITPAQFLRHSDAKLQPQPGAKHSSRSPSPTGTAMLPCVSPTPTQPNSRASRRRSIGTHLTRC